MNNGDFVTAVPASEEMRSDYPKVTGRLEISDSEFMGEEFHVFTVHAMYADGDDCPVEVQEEGILPVSFRRAKTTTFPLPEA